MLLRKHLHTDGLEEENGTGLPWRIEKLLRLKRQMQTSGRLMDNRTRCI